MANPNLFARTEARYRRWDQTALDNEDIRKRVRGGEPVSDVAADYGMSTEKAQRIAGLFGV